MLTALVGLVGQLSKLLYASEAYWKDLMYQIFEKRDDLKHYRNKKIRKLNVHNNYIIYEFDGLYQSKQVSKVDVLSNF